MGLLINLIVHPFSKAKNLIVVCLILFCINANVLYATHNRAGEITYEQIGDLSIRATIVTYTRTSSFAADRDSLTLFWGDGDSTIVLRSNGNGFELPNDIKRNEYVSEHTFPTRGTYVMSVVDPNRIAGILNIDFPNSVNIRFYIETTLTLLEPRFQGRNNSAILLQPPIDFACVGQVYTYNPNAYDVDGDSLSYELVTPLSNIGIEVPNYQLPDEINPGSDNMIHLNPINGDFSWDAPQTQGEYNITYRINEYREGFLINSILRDMQILVRACPDQNNAPQISSIEEICVVAGTIVEIDLIASDIDSAEILAITASGGPFEINENRAVLSTDTAIENSMLNGKITWQTSCNDVSKEFYQIVVRVTDDLSNGMTGLATLRTIRIKVVAPSPTVLDVENINNVVTIRWTKPYECENSELFQGFSVWRRLGSTNLIIDNCDVGLEGQGFEKIVFLTQEEEDGFYISRDIEIEPGNIYCYRIIGEFAQLTDVGNLFNRTESLPSEEICIRSSGEEPLITNVSILETDQNDGSLIVQWINPDATAIDTTILTGPYQVALYGAENLNGENLDLITSFEYGSGEFALINDTSVIIESIDTRTTGHSYNVNFKSGIDPDSFSSSSDVASSIFLNANGRDRSILLNWQENVPWNNYQYLVFEKVNDNLVLIDSTTDRTLTIENLVNGNESCYVVESLGKYGISDIREPLINYSNSSCARPMDDRAPCPPEIEIRSLCDNATISIDEALINTVFWSFSNSSCIRAGDLAKLRLYFATNEIETPVLLTELDITEEFYSHQLDDNISGCYAISAVDSSGNESELTQSICVDNCPSYVLPNAFTPNADNANDLFIPRENRFIDRVEFLVYNRWGQKVFETNDPFLNWDGTNFGNKMLREGTYFYTCKVFERRVTGVEETDILRGTIQLIR